MCKCQGSVGRARPASQHNPPALQWIGPIATGVRPLWGLWVARWPPARITSPASASLASPGRAPAALATGPLGRGGGCHTESSSGGGVGKLVQIGTVFILLRTNVSQKNPSTEVHSKVVSNKTTMSAGSFQALPIRSPLPFAPLDPPWSHLRVAAPGGAPGGRPPGGPRRGPRAHPPPRAHEGGRRTPDIHSTYLGIPTVGLSHGTSRRAIRCFPR